MKALLVAVCALVLAGCGSTPVTQPHVLARHPTATVGPPTTSPGTTLSPVPVSAPPSPRWHDPRWRFFTTDRAWHTSPWFAGRHRVMIGYGCNVSPWYSPDPRCPGREGFHHGIDVAMRCGTRLFAGIDGTVVDPHSAGTPGPAYGPYAFRIRNVPRGVDVLIGHVRTVYVAPGDRVRRGELIARASDQGAPDGCHLHFEVRAIGGGLDSARDPARLLVLSPPTGRGAGAGRR